MEFRDGIFAHFKGLSGSERVKEVQRLYKFIAESDDVLSIVNRLNGSIPNLMQAWLDEMKNYERVFDLKTQLTTDMQVALQRIQEEENCQIQKGFEALKTQSKSIENEFSLTEEKVSLPSQKLDGDTKSELYALGFDFLKLGNENSSMLESYSLGILQSIANNFSALREVSLNETATISGSLEWAQLTARFGNTVRSNQLLHQLSLLTSTSLDFKSGKEKCDRLFRSYFANINFAVQIIIDLQEFPTGKTNKTDNTIDIIMLEEDKTLSLIVSRELIHKNPTSLAQSIIEDFGYIPNLTNYFRQVLVKSSEDTFGRHTVTNSLFQDIESLFTFEELIGLLFSKGFPQDKMLSTLSKNAKMIEVTYLERMVRDFKLELVRALGAAMEELIIQEREIYQSMVAEREQENEDAEEAIRYLETEHAYLSCRLEKLETEVDEENNLLQRISSDMNRLRSIQNLKDLMAELPPNHISGLLELDSRTTGKEIKLALLTSFGESCLFKVQIEEVFSHAQNLEKYEVLKLVDYVQSLFTMNIEKKEENWISFTSHHLSTSRCLEKAQSFFHLMQNSTRKRQTIQIDFVGKSTLQIDCSFVIEVFHGVNLTFVAPRVAVVAPGGPIVIDVSGLNGFLEHTIKKPPTPSAFGADGIEGKAGDDGESGGHVVICSIKNIPQMQMLIVKSIGGNGGNGQDGGDGAAGGDGKAGRNGKVSDNHPTAAGVRKEFMEGLPGKQGKDGGHGAPGGTGGRGGCGGRILIDQGAKTLEVTPEKPGAVQALFTKNGDPGLDGKPGNGGQGGKGGSHGVDAAWYTYSAWFWDEWKHDTGNLTLVPHDHVFSRGYTCIKGGKRPPASIGQRGNTSLSHEHKESTGLSLVPEKVLHGKPALQQKSRTPKKSGSGVQTTSTTSIISGSQDVQERARDSLTQLQQHAKNIEKSKADAYLHTERLSEFHRQCKEITAEYESRITTTVTTTLVRTQVEKKFNTIVPTNCIAPNTRRKSKQFDVDKAPLRKRQNPDQATAENEACEWMKPFNLILESRSCHEEYTAYEKCIKVCTQNLFLLFTNTLFGLSIDLFY